MSSAEAEFRGVAKGITEVLWLRKLLTELGFTPTRSCELYCDNQAAINISENPVQHDRTKHVEVDRDFIKEKLEARVIKLPHVKSKDQLANILTKAVELSSLKKFYASWVLVMLQPNLKGSVKLCILVTCIRMAV